MQFTEPATIARLREIRLLRDLPEDVLESLRPHLHDCVFKQGEQILRVGEYCDGAYYLISGKVEANMPALAAPTSKTSRSQAPVSIMLTEMPVAMHAGKGTLLGAGEIFGEGSALSRYPIAIDMFAVTDVSCLMIRTPALRAMFDVPELASFKALFDQRYKERTLASHLARVDIFSGLDASVIQRLIERAELVTFKPGKKIATEGEPCDTFYLVRGGYVKVSVGTEPDIALTYLRMGDWIGEASLLADVPWPYSLEAIEHVELVKIARADLAVLVPSAASDKRVWDVMVERLLQRGKASTRPLDSRPLQFAIDSGLIHGDSVLLIDLETCVRCDECVRACADAHDGTPRFLREGIKFQNLTVPTACYQCTDPVCMIGCPTGAISRPLGTLEVAIDPGLCIGCGNCVKRCPWGNISTVPYNSPKVGSQINLAIKCDLCLDRPEGPACVQMCPQGSTQRVSFKDHARVASLFSR
jgi:Fe-S-cluster-containing hydrogenase component 2/CRP-like cAMP-binding protein